MAFSGPLLTLIAVSNQIEATKKKPGLSIFRSMNLLLLTLIKKLRKPNKVIKYIEKEIEVVKEVPVKKIVKEIIEIASNLSYFKFYIIGKGPLLKEIENLILKKNINNVFLLGEQKNIFNYLYSSDIYLSTSLYEGLPISILEAMSIGLPIVASNVIGNCDTIENGKSGFLYQLNDTNTLECWKRYQKNVQNNSNTLFFPYMFELCPPPQKF